MLEIDSVKVVCEADVYTTAEDKNKHDYLTMSQPPKNIFISLRKLWKYV